MKTVNFSSKSIPKLAEVNWQRLRKIEISDNGEELVSMSLIPEKIIVQPQYYMQGIKGALPDCYIRRENLNRIYRASKLLKPGYKFLIYDAWRPAEVQKIIFEKYFNELKKEMPAEDDAELQQLTSKFVSLPSENPENPSPHLTGGAVDLTIIDDKGKVLNMGTGFDETSDRAATRYYEELSKLRKLSIEEEKILRNRRLLYHIMTEVGFVNYEAEWWHYDYGNQFWGSIIGQDAKYGLIKLE